jgi:hypothetical protein
MKPTCWLAIISPRSSIGFPFDVTSRDDDLNSTLNWARRRGLRIAGRFATQRQARERINAWLEKQPPYEHTEHIKPRARRARTGEKY